MTTTIGMAGSVAPAAAAAAHNRVMAGATGGSWVFQGPAPQLNAIGQDLVNVAAADEPVSGAVTAIAASPTDPNLVYLGTANGGVWKTTTATAASPTWTPLTDNLKGLSIGIGAVALDPTDPTGQTLVAGTGRSSGFAGLGDDLVGLYYSTNGGTTWTTITLGPDTWTTAANITGVAARGNTLLAAAEGGDFSGLFRTTGGPSGTWTELSGTRGLPKAIATGIAADPANPNRLYVTFIGASGGIFRTDDLGDTWTNVTSGIDVIASDTYTFNAAVYNDGTTSVVTVVLRNGDDEYALFRSVNGAPFTGLEVPRLHPGSSPSIVADKTNPNLVYVGSYGTMEPPSQTAVYRLDASQPTGSQVTTLADGGTGYGRPHVDINYVTRDASGGLLIGCHGGIFRLPQPASAASASNYWVSENSNLGVSEIHDIAYDHVSHIMIAGLQDNAVAFQSAPGSRAWPVGPGLGGDGGDVAAADLTLPSTTAASTTLAITQEAYWNDIFVNSLEGFPVIGNFYISIDNEQMFVSTVMNEPYGSYTHLNKWFKVIRGVNGTTRATHNGGAAVTLLPQPLSIRYGSAQNLALFTRLAYNAANGLVGKASISYSTINDAPFSTPIAVNAVDPKRLLIGGTNNLYESLDLGETIANIATTGVNDSGYSTYKGPIAYGGRLNGVANPDVLYIGYRYWVYARTTAGGPVEPVTLPPTGSGFIQSIALNPDDYTNVFITDYTDVYVTTTGGSGPQSSAWRKITGDLGATQLTALAFVAGPSPYLAVATRSGVFAAPLSDLGNWRQLGTGLPDVPVFDLAYDATDDVLVVGSLGRGAWTFSQASTAFVPSGVAPVLTMTSAPTTATEGATEYSYSFAVSDPGDRFTGSTPTITGGSLVAGSLTTTASGGSFKVTFPDGPASASISLKVTDSTGLASNTVTTLVTVNNAPPRVLILGAPTSGSPGTPINLTGSAIDPSPADNAAGFTSSWTVLKLVGSQWYTFKTGSGTSFSYTPDVAAQYKVSFGARDKDGASGGRTIIINAASPDLTENTPVVTVGEGQPAVNSGTFQNVNGNPLTLSASVGTLTRNDNPPVLFEDSFDSEPLGFTQTSLSTWNVISGNIDVIGPGLDDFYPGHGHYLETGGTTNAIIQSKSSFNLTPGVYQLSFEIGNNSNGSGNGVHITLGSALDASVAATNTLTAVARQFTVSSAISASLVFAETGPDDRYGSVLDDVRLVRLRPVSGTWSWSYVADDGPAQGQDVTITATDTVNGEVTSLPFSLVVENVAPTATLSNNGPVYEGSTATVAFSDQSDPSAADTSAGFHYAYDFDNDGVFEIGDGTYAGSGTAASATVAASFLADGPGSRTVRGRILDKDGGFTEYTTDITITNAAPVASASGPASALAGQVVTFVLKGADTSPADRAAGFTYSINWGDGSSLQTVDPVAGTGDATARHAYAAVGSYTIQVTATDKNGATGAPASTTIQVNALTPSSLQALIGMAPVVYLQPADDAALHTEVSAINSLAAPTSPVQITIVLDGGQYSGVTLSPPSNIILDLAGNHTADFAGTHIAGASPAVTVTRGEVFVQGESLSTATDSPTVLVTGGHLTLGQSNIQESTGFNSVALKVTGGSVNLGFDILMNVNGDGGFVSSYRGEAVEPHPEGIDADLSPNTFQVNGVTISAVNLSSTSLTSSPSPSVFGQAATFTATLDIEVPEHGPATGAVTFYDGTIVLGTSPVSKVGDEFVASFSTSALGVGTHTIMALYGGDQVYVASAAVLTHMVGPIPFTGFFSPVDNPPTLNRVNSGQSIPFKFSLGSDRGLNIIATGYPISQQFNCTTGTPINSAQQATAAMPLSYDPASGRYTYVWKTQKSWFGTCRQLTLRLADGTEHAALFQFK